MHPYTFRNEDVYLDWSWSQDIYNEYDVFFVDIGIDGAFTDHPATLYRYGFGEHVRLDGHDMFVGYPLGLALVSKRSASITAWWLHNVLDVVWHGGDIL